MSDTKITYGLKKLAYAKITFGEDGKVTYGKPVMLPGARAIALSPVGEDVAVYADDINYVNITSNQGYDGDVTVLGIPEAFLTDIMGMKKDTNGAIVENADDAKSPFALLGEFSSETALKKRFVLYNCTAGRPDFASNTKEESTEATEYAIPLIASPATDTGDVKASVVGGVEANAAFDGWYDAVYLKQKAGA